MPLGHAAHGGAGDSFPHYRRAGWNWQGGDVGGGPCTAKKDDKKGSPKNREAFNGAGERIYTTISCREGKRLES